MIRPVATDFLLFVAPFVLYAAFLFVTRASVLDPGSWSARVLAWLVIAALACVLTSFIVLTQFGRAPPYSTYVPAHVEDGRLVPGRIQ